MLADGPAHGAVFFVDRAGLLQQAGGDFGRPAGREALPAAAFMRSNAQKRLTAVGRLVAR